MSFLLDTDICSAYLRGNVAVFNRFVQHSGGLHISTISLGELYSWAYRSKSSSSLAAGLSDLLSEITLLDVNGAVALKFGRVRAALLDRGRPAPEADLFIASTALVHDLTLVTHNVQDFAGVPDLRIEDWLAT